MRKLSIFITILLVMFTGVRAKAEKLNNFQEEFLEENSALLFKVDEIIDHHLANSNIDDDTVFHGFENYKSQADQLNQYINNLENAFVENFNNLNEYVVMSELLDYGYFEKDDQEAKEKAFRKLQYDKFERSKELQRRINKILTYEGDVYKMDIEFLKYNMIELKFETGKLLADRFDNEQADLIYQGLRYDYKGE